MKVGRAGAKRWYWKSSRRPGMTCGMSADDGKKGEAEGQGQGEPEAKEDAESVTNEFAAPAACVGGGGAPRAGTEGKGINNLWIGQCVVCGKWFNLARRYSRIPQHEMGHPGTYPPAGYRPKS